MFTDASFHWCLRAVVTGLCLAKEANIQAEVRMLHEPTRTLPGHLQDVHGRFRWPEDARTVCDVLVDSGHTSSCFRQEAGLGIEKVNWNIRIHCIDTYI